MSSVCCPGCGSEFTNKGIGHHWRQSNCSQPEITSYQEDLVTGLLMGDGCIESRKSGSILYLGMINKPFLDWVDDQFGLLSTGVKKRDTAAESAERARKSGFRPSAKSENYHDVYMMRTRTLSDLDEFRGWYSTGQKVFPDVELTPTIAKMWYCTDGGLAASKLGRNQAQIRCRNESERIGYLVKMFNDVGFNPTVTNNDTRLCFDSNETEEFLNWMGDPAPGFEYKWVSSSYDEYHSEKEKIFNRLDRM